MSRPSEPWFVEVYLLDTGQPLVDSTYHHCPKRADYFSEDVDPYYPTRDAAQSAADRLNVANARPWVRYGVGQIIEVIPVEPES